MTPRTWAAITHLFEQALDQAPPDRARFLAEVARRDPAAAAEVASLLEVHDRPGEFLPELPIAADPPDLAGRVVGTYRLLRLIGTGGMGAVYLAERNDGAFERRVAVKLLSSAFLQSRGRFLREREFLARVDHPNIARLLDAGTTADHVPYLVMEYVDGVPIDRYCAEREATIDDRVALLLQVCAGVAHAHTNLIIHCDIKPENILVTPDGQAKLLDFGIARLLDPERTITEHRPATPAHSSPEQLHGGVITTVSDVYALGVLAYVLLTGSGPHAPHADHVAAIVHAVLTTEPRRASETPGLPAHVARRLRGDFDNVLAKAVAREPSRRYASVDQLADDLRACVNGYPVRARPQTVAYRLQRVVGRHRLTFAVGGLMALGLVAAAVSSTWQARLAQRRFDDLKAFAHTVVFDVNDALAPIPGTTGARKLVVETALRYLDRLSQGRVPEPALREELAAAYLRIGKVQGGAFLPNLGDSAGATASFRKAIEATEAEGRTPALDRLRIEALINVASLASDPIQGVPGFDEAIRAAERRLADDPLDLQSLRLLADALQGRATVAHLTNHVRDHAAIATRQVEVRERLRARVPDRWEDQASLARALAQHALALEQQRDYTGALARLIRARDILSTALARASSHQILQRGLAEVRSRAITVLLALDRPTDAEREGQAAVDLLQPLVTSDPANIQYRADLAYAWLRLGDVRRAEGRLDAALDYHRRALAIRRERAERHPGFVFVPWELTRSLNAVADLYLSQDSPGVREATTLFTEAREAGLRALADAPSYTQVRKQVATAEEGLARASRAGGAGDDAVIWWRRSAESWREVVSRGSADERAVEDLRRVETQLKESPPRTGVQTVR